MSVWSALAGLGFGGMLVITAAIQPHGRKLRRWVKERDPCYYLPTWTFFAPDPGVMDTRLVWRERLVDGTIGPWHEAVAPCGGVRRALWNPTKRARKVIFDLGRMLESRAQRSEDSELSMLSLPYLIILQHVVGLPVSPLGAARQFALLKTQGADDDGDGLFELLFVSVWHLLPDLGPDRRLGQGANAQPVDAAA